MGSLQLAASASQAMQARGREPAGQASGRVPVKPIPDFPVAFNDLGYDFEDDESLPGLIAPNALAQRAMKHTASTQDWGIDKNLRLEQLWIEGASSLDDAPSKESTRPADAPVDHRDRSPSPLFVESIRKPPRIGTRWMTWLCATRRPRYSAAVAPRAGEAAEARSASASSSPELGSDTMSGHLGQPETQRERDGVPRSGCLAEPEMPVERNGVGEGETAVEIEDVCVQVPEGMVALAWLNGQPLLLSSGVHSFASRSFSMKELVPESTRVIHHGCLHRVVIPAEHLGIAWVNGKPEILEPGVFLRSCTTFSYSPRNDQNLMEKELVLGPFRIVTVNEDEVGIKFRNRKPSVLYRGRHTIDISKAEVFAGFESLCCRRSRISDLVATTADDMRVEAQLSFNWQIGPDDAACARLANVADVEGAVSAKFRRAFALVMWCYKGRDIVDMHAKSDLSQNELIHISQMSSSFSSDISKECLEVVVDLFEEGWTVTFWEVQLERLQLYLDTPAQATNDQSCKESTIAEQEASRQKKKVLCSGTDQGQLTEYGYSPRSTVGYEALRLKL